MTFQSPLDSSFHLFQWQPSSSFLTGNSEIMELWNYRTVYLAPDVVKLTNDLFVEETWMLYCEWKRNNRITVLGDFCLPKLRCIVQ
jgi:hypothetical protein